MKDPYISVDDWFAYLDGVATEDTRRRIDAALSSHPPTREIYESLRESDQLLRSEALALHRSAELPPSAVEEACARVLNRLQHPALSRARLDRCEQILEPWCGRRVAASLVLAAVARTRAETSEALWPVFLGHAEALASGLCGVAASRLLVELSGSLV